MDEPLRGRGGSRAGGWSGRREMTGRICGPGAENEKKEEEEERGRHARCSPHSRVVRSGSDSTYSK